MDSHFERNEKGGISEPKETHTNFPPYLTSPFNYFGAYVVLNLKEKASVAESSLIIYYKEVLMEVSEKNKVLESEVEILKELNMSYYI